MVARDWVEGLRLLPHAIGRQARSGYYLLSVRDAAAGSRTLRRSGAAGGLTRPEGGSPSVRH
jgi:hypothetical protein